MNLLSMQIKIIINCIYSHCSFKKENNTRNERKSMRTIQSIKQEQLDEALDFVKKVYTDSEGEESGILVMNLVIYS